MVRLTVYMPFARYKCAGFWSCDVLPSPKSHDHAIGSPFERSEKLTINGEVPYRLSVKKSATGGLMTWMKPPVAAFTGAALPTTGIQQQNRKKTSRIDRASLSRLRPDKKILLSARAPDMAYIFGERVCEDIKTSRKWFITG
jgi:hypothetical protein